MENKTTYPNMRSLERALELLDCFISSERELSLTELSSITSLSPSTVHRLTQVLTNKLYLIKNESNKKYYLGPKITQLGSTSLTIMQKDLRSIAHPYLTKIYEKFQETVGLYIFEGDYRLCIDRIQTTQILRNVVPIGQLINLSVGGVGKILLAYMPKERVKSIIEDYSDDFEQTLENIRKNKYYVSYGERVDGIVAIGVPVLNSLGDIICILSISGPTIRFTEDIIEQMLNYLTEVGKDFSYTLGYPHDYNIYNTIKNDIIVGN